MESDYNLDSASEFVLSCGRSWGAGIPLARQFAEMLLMVLERSYWRKFKIQVKTYENSSFTEWVTSHPPKGLGATIQEVDEALANAGHKEALARFRAEVAQREVAPGDEMEVKRGRPENGVSVTPLEKGGHRSSNLLRRIARSHPEILSRYEQGDFPSVRQAAIAAGIIKVPTAYEKAQKAYEKLSEEDREQFKKWLAETT